MKIMLIEDSPEIVNTVSLTFKLSWSDAVLVSTDNGAKGIKMTETESPDIIILDINLPDIEGFQVLKEIRLFSNVPVIILTIREAEVDKIRGLETGADDYITKPFSPLDLLARVKAVLRRTGVQRSRGEDIPPYITANLTINFATREVILNGERLHFTPNEYKLLSHLVRNEGRTVTQQALQRWVWGGTEYVDPSTIKKYIYQLRTKLDDTPGLPKIILNERGVGYKFARPS